VAAKSYKHCLIVASEMPNIPSDEMPDLLSWNAKFGILPIKYLTYEKAAVGIPRMKFLVSENGAIGIPGTKYLAFPDG
jgi:hypothetical protein